MAYKIAGTKNDIARIFVLNETTNTLETQVLLSGTGSYEITGLVAGRKLVVARKLDGESVAYGYIDPVVYATLATVTTQAVSSITATSFIGNGNIIDTGDADCARRGFCYMLGSSGDPTTANSVAYDDGAFGVGAYTKIVEGLSESTGYRVRAYAVNLIGTSYGTTVQANTTYPVGQRGLFGGPTNVIDYITISTTGDAVDFGDLTTWIEHLASCSSSTRGVFGGGYASANSSLVNYITIATKGNAVVFGYLTLARAYIASCSSSTRGVFGGGYTTAVVNNIDYITIATTGNAADFGDLTLARRSMASCSSSTRGVFGGGYTTAVVNNIDYITIATTGNAADFGDLTVARYTLAACSSSTRGVFGGGSNVPDTVDYITIATTGNASDFGNLTVGRFGVAACSSSTRGVFGGGSGGSSNIIDYITISTTGNAADFGDLTVARGLFAACSDGHGGLS